MQAVSNVVELNRSVMSKVYIPTIKSLNSYWLGLLLPSHLAILQFIVERTLRWGKESEVIPYSHFYKGVWSGGIQIQSRVPYSLPTIFRSVKDVERFGFVDITRVRSTHRGYEANRFEINFKVIVECDMAKVPALPVPKRLKNTPETGGTPSINDALPLLSSVHHPFYQRRTTNIHKEKIHKEKKHKELAAPKTALETIAFVTQQHAVRRREVKGATPATCTQESLRRMWHTAMLEHYPSVPLEGINVPRVMKTFKLAAAVEIGKDTDLRDFFGWLIPLWPSLRGGSLAWLNKKREVIPLAPNFIVLTNFMRPFAREFRDRVMEDTLNTARKAQDRASRALIDADEVAALLAKKDAEVRTLRTKLDMQRRESQPPVRTRVRTQMTKDSLRVAAKVYDEDVDLGNWDD